MKHRLLKKEKQRLIISIIPLLVDQDIIAAYLFGSFVASDAFRDIDVALLTEPTSADPLNLELRLENQLEESLKYPVDVRVINKAPISFCQNVFRTGEVILDRDPNKRADFEGRILKEYFDFAPYRRRYLQEVINAPV
jgi:predicted nucleotidyltransferase